MVDGLTTKIYADGADLEEIFRLAADTNIRGFTTNPSLMWKAGLTHYSDFARALLDRVTHCPVSFEVFADEPDEIVRQAREIAGWGDNVFVKVPVTTTKGEALAPVVRELSQDGVKVNVTAVFTMQQVEALVEALAGGAPSNGSVFAGRIADEVIDPVRIVRDAVLALRGVPQAEVIWASPREVLNVVQADSVGCHIITMTGGLLDRLGLLGKDLHAYSLETVQMFHRDAQAAGFELS